MPAFMIDESPMLAAAAALPPRTQLPPSTPPAPPAAPAARYPIDARAAESVEMPLDDLSLPSEPRASAPQSVPVRSSAVPSAPPSMPFAPAGLPSSSVPPDESRPEPNEVVRVAREMVKAAARMELERARASAPAASLEVAIDMDEPVEAVPVDFDEAPEPEEEAPPSLGQWPGPDWVDRSIPSAPSPLGRSLHSDPLERPVRSAAPPAPLRSQPPAAHRWDADFSSPEQDAFQTDDEPMPEWTAPAPRPSPAPVAEDPLVREARARAERMQEAFARFSNRASAPAPAAPEPSEPAVDYSAGLDAELALASDAAATEIAVPSDLYGMEDEPLGSPEDEAIPADEPYDFEPVPLEAEALQSMPPEPTPPPRPPAWSREDSAGFSGNPPAFEQNVLADPRPSFVSAPSAPSSGEVAMLEALLGQIRERRRNPSRYWESV